MFTGIIEETGEVLDVVERNEVLRIRFRAKDIMGDLRLGSSIAVNGCCLTVVEFDETSFRIDLVRESMNRTSLKNAAPGMLVNLERPMRADGRFDGHIVQGHVDGVGRIAKFSRAGDNWTLEVDYPAQSGRYIVEKGSIAVDGISLTVASVDSSTLQAAIIPHTFENTNLRQAKAGDVVNLEFDVVAKYVERMIAAREINV